MGAARVVTSRWPPSAARPSRACGHRGARGQRGGRMGAAGPVGYRVGGHHPVARSKSPYRTAAHGASAEGGWVQLRVSVL